MVEDGEGRIVSSVLEVNDGDEITVKLLDGQLSARVTDRRTNKEIEG